MHIFPSIDIIPISLLHFNLNLIIILNFNILKRSNLNRMNLFPISLFFIPIIYIIKIQFFRQISGRTCNIVRGFSRFTLMFTLNFLLSSSSKVFHLLPHLPTSIFPINQIANKSSQPNINFIFLHQKLKSI